MQCSLFVSNFGVSSPCLKSDFRIGSLGFFLLFIFVIFLCQSSTISLGAKPKLTCSTVIVKGGVPPFKYLWSHGPTTPYLGGSVVLCCVERAPLGRGVV
jgi:hypothetical protein